MLSALLLDANNAAHHKRPHNFQMPMATYGTVALVPPAPARVMLSSGSVLFLKGLVFLV
jgi:hypothetical protein